MRTMTRITLAALPLALSLGLTGCGGDDGGDQVASAGGKGGAAAGAGKSLSRDEMGVKFAQCLRENGVPVEDPEPGKGIAIKIEKGQVPQGAVEKAMEKCRQYDPQANSPERKADMAERGRKFAECMRKNGVEAFPDPEPGQAGLRITPEIGEDPDFQKAQQACQDLMGGPGGGPSGGAGQ